MRSQPNGLKCLESTFSLYCWSQCDQRLNWTSGIHAEHCTLLIQVQLLATGALVWIWTRNDLNKSLVPFVTVMLGLCIFRGLIVEVIVQAFALSSWMLLMCKGLFTLVISGLALQLYVGFVEAS